MVCTVITTPFGFPLVHSLAAVSVLLQPLRNSSPAVIKNASKLLRCVSSSLSLPWAVAFPGPLLQAAICRASCRHKCCCWRCPSSSRALRKSLSRCAAVGGDDGIVKQRNSSRKIPWREGMHVMLRGDVGAAVGWGCSHPILPQRRVLPRVFLLLCGRIFLKPEHPVGGKARGSSQLSVPQCTEEQPRGLLSSQQENRCGGSWCPDPTKRYQPSLKLPPKLPEPHH